MIEPATIAETLSSLSDLRPLWHPLGFVSVVVKEDDAVAIRLHYWPAGERRPKNPNWPIHNHVFELCSTIITGEIIDRQYESCDGLERQIYRAVNSGPD